MIDPDRDIDWTRLVPVAHLQGDDEEDTRQLRDLASEAQRYLLRHTWCEAVLDQWFGEGQTPHVGVFLCKVIASIPDVDQFTWAIVGDLPPARISPVYARNAWQALDGYVREMSAWIRAVRAGGSVKHLIPVNVAPTREFADLLERRTKLIADLFIGPNAHLLQAPVAADRLNLWPSNE